MRLDLALVQANLVPTRTKAKATIEAGLVSYKEDIVLKPSTDIQDLSQLKILGQFCPYVSRGGLKLEKALRCFDVSVRDKVVLDIGSSTGGFTDCALKEGAKHVIAIDVGRDQMDKHLRQNPNITLYEQTDFRNISLEKIKTATLIVSDVSFISLEKLLPKMVQLPLVTDIICLIKPQFECGPQIAQKYQGVILNQTIHESVLSKVILAFEKAHLFLKEITYSPIMGGSGNIEYLAHFTRNSRGKKCPLKSLILEAFQNLKS